MQSGRPQIAFPIDAMLDQSIEQSSGAVPGTLSELINLRKDRNGRLVKRTGYPSTGAGSLQAPVRLLPHGNAVAMADKSGILNSYGEGVNTWGVRDRTPQWALKRARVIGQVPYYLTFAGCVSASGATIHIFVDQNIGAVKSIVVDEVSGDVVRPAETIVTIDGGLGETAIPLARIVSNGTQLWLFYQVVNGSGNGLRVVRSTVSNLLAGGAWSAYSGVGGGDMDTAAPSFDVTVSASFAYCAYNSDSAGTKRLRVHRVDTSGTTTHSYTGSPIACRAVSCFWDGTELWVHYALTSAGGVNTDVRVFDATLSLLATNGGPGCISGAVQATGVGYYDSNSVILMSGNGTSTYNPKGHINFCRADYAAGVITLSQFLTSYGCVPASQPFRTGVGGDGSDCYMWVECSTSSTDAFACVALIALTHDGGSLYSVTTSFAVGEFPHLRVQNGRVSAFTYASSDYQVPQKVYVSSQDADTYVWDSAFRVPPETPAAIREYRFQKASPQINAAMMPCEAQGLTLATGGCQTFSYDGSRFTELAFSNPPQGASDYVTMNGSGGSIGAGTYFWAVTYEYTDEQGLKHQSAPWFSGSHVAVASDKAILAVPTLKMTTKQDREFTSAALRVVIWRTLATDSTTFYRVTSAQNNPEVSTVTVNDTLADASISVQEILYTVRGELANECPPPLWHAVAFGGRVAGIDSEYRDRIVFSKVLTAERGIEWFSENQTYVRGIGDLTALAEMDGNLYAFSATGIAWAAAGAGIDATGNGSWPEAQILSRACGCIDPRALCVSQDGVVFVSRQGSSGVLRVWLLPRGGGNPIEIGAKARKYLGNQSWFTTSGFISGTLSVMSVVNWVDQGRVSITLRGTSSSFRIEYDYVNRGADGIGVWNADYGTAFDASGGVASTTVARGALWIAAATPDVLRSSETSYLDGSSTFVPYRLRTHDIKPSLIPFSKLNQLTVTLETSGVNGGVTFELSEDAAQTFPYSNTFAFASVSAGAQVQRQWEPANRRSSTGHGYALQLSSVAPGGGNDNTADVIPRAVSIDYIALRGTHRPQASERA